MERKRCWCIVQPHGEPEVPEIIWHDARKNHPGESMALAKEAGQEHFRIEPQIIFVCLPDTGELNWLPEPPEDPVPSIDAGQVFHYPPKHCKIG